MNTSLNTSLNTSRCAGLLLIVVLALAAALAPILPASAQEGEQCVETEAGTYCPAGIACAFPLQIAYSDMHMNYREFYDKDDNLKGLILAGGGYVVTLTNLDTGASLSEELNGTFFREKINADGTEIVSTSGHFFMVVYPIDQPPGPSAKIYTGHAVFLYDANGASILQQLSGQSTDMCAALSN